MIITIINFKVSFDTLYSILRVRQKPELVSFWFMNFYINSDCQRKTFKTMIDRGKISFKAQNPQFKNLTHVYGYTIFYMKTKN